MAARPSSAIKIVAPAAGNSSTPPPDNPKVKKESQRQCRNILIHGYCKFEGRGCIYQHPLRTGASAEDQETNQNQQINVNAPVFVPKTQTPSLESSKSSLSIAPEFTPSLNVSRLTLADDYNQNGSDTAVEDAVSTSDQNLYHQSQPMDVNLMMHYDSPHAPLDMTSDGYYAAAPAVPHPFIRQPLDYHLYAPVKEMRHPFAKHYISQTLHEDLAKRSEAMHFALPPLSYTGIIPEEVSGYQNIVPLQNPPVRMGSWTVTMWRGVHADSGDVRLLRRVENFRLPHEQAFQSIAAWKRIKSPNIIPVHEAFTTRAWGDSSLVLVYDYHPTARNIIDEQIRLQSTGSIGTKRGQFPSTQHQGLVDERTIWSYVIQIACGIKAVHDGDLAVRSLGIGDGSDIWITNKNRVRIGAAAIWDVLAYDPARFVGGADEIRYAQQDDLLAFGKLIITMASSPGQAVHIHKPDGFQMAKTIETIGRTYSADLKKVIIWCLSNHPNHPKSIAQLFDMIGSRLLGEMDAMQLRGDTLENMLMSELENTRMVRLMCKLGFINERPEFDHDPRWSETGDRYIIKLFRDYVFHQVDEAGQPVLDVGHVVTCMNKLDAGSEERLMLISRDEQSCLVVSYKDIKACIASIYRDLARK